MLGKQNGSMNVNTKSLEGHFPAWGDLNASTSQERYIKKHYPDFWLSIKEHYGAEWTEKLYNFYHPNTKHICPVCGRLTKFKNKKHGYNRYCSLACAYKDEARKTKIKETYTKHHGAMGFASKEIREKAELTNLELYGIKNPSKQFQEKARQTNLKRYGGTGLASKEIREKAEKTSLKLYGKKHYTNPDKAQNTCLRLYGVKRTTQLDSIKEKVKQTNLEKYGVKNVSQLDSIKEKVKQTNLERYGVENVSQLDSIKEKVKQTNLEKYGVENVSQLDSIKEKVKQTNLECYNGTGFASKELNEKTKQTNLVRYGVEHFTNPEKAKQTNLERYGVERYNNPEKAKQTNLERYGVECYNNPEKAKQSIRQNQINTHPDLLGYMEDGSWICKCPDPKCDKCTEKCYITKSQIYYDRKRLNIELCTKKLPIQPSYSTFELEIREYLDSLNVTHQDNIRGIIGPKELDIYIPDKKLAIECNGSYWHSIECGEGPSDPNYHIDKYLKCKEKGIKLITIWDDWWTQNRSECEALIQYHLGLINEFHPTHLPTDTTDTNLHPTDNVVPVKVNHSGFDCWVGQFNIKS